jgi:outer membrane biosynthesis protein TonB
VWIATLFAFALAILGLQLTASSADRRLEKGGVCQRESAAIAGRKGVLVGDKIAEPRKIRDAKPNYPTFPPGTVGSGVWVGEALIGSDGKIARVWTIREITIKPPLPAFNQAIVNAMRQWEFEPARVDDVAVPLCMTVTIAIDWM